MKKVGSIIGVVLVVALIVFKKVYWTSSHKYGREKNVEKVKNHQNKVDYADTSADKKLYNAVLFKEYTYGMPFSQFSGSSEFYDCSDVFGQTAVCRDNVEFLGHRFTAALIFDHEALTQVTLYDEYSDELFQKLILSLPKNNFALVLMRDSKQQIDIMKSLHAKGMNETQKIIAEFESRMADEPDVYFSFVENPQLYKSSKNISELIQALTETTRGIDLDLEEDGENSWLYLTFSFPKKDLNQLIKKEDF